MTQHTTSVLRPFVRDYLGEPVPEETLTIMNTTTKVSRQKYYLKAKKMINTVPSALRNTPQLNRIHAVSSLVNYELVYYYSTLTRRIRFKLLLQMRFHAKSLYLKVKIQQSISNTIRQTQQSIFINHNLSVFQRHEITHASTYQKQTENKCQKMTGKKTKTKQPVKRILTRSSSGESMARNMSSLPLPITNTCTQSLFNWPFILCTRGWVRSTIRD